MSGPANGPLTWCCLDMQRQSTLFCTVHTDPFDCPDVMVIWSPAHGPGLPVRDGGASSIGINFCPWCGTRVGLGEATA